MRDVGGHTAGAFNGRGRSKTRNTVDMRLNNEGLQENGNEREKLPNARAGARSHKPFSRWTASHTHQCGSASKTDVIEYRAKFGFQSVSYQSGAKRDSTAENPCNTIHSGAPSAIAAQKRAAANAAALSFGAVSSA
jgi:hypothetical protein